MSGTGVGSGSGVGTGVGSGVGTGVGSGVGSGGGTGVGSGVGIGVGMGVGSDGGTGVVPGAVDGGGGSGAVGGGKFAPGGSCGAIGAGVGSAMPTMIGGPNGTALAGGMEALASAGTDGAGEPVTAGVGWVSDVAPSEGDDLESMLDPATAPRSVGVGSVHGVIVGTLGLSSSAPVVASRSSTRTGVRIRAPFVVLRSRGPASRRSPSAPNRSASASDVERRTAANWRGRPAIESRSRFTCMPAGMEGTSHT